MRRLASAASLALLLATSARAQSTYDQYGEVVDVTVQSLAETPSAYEGRAVRVKGRFEMGASVGQRTYIMKDSFVAQILIFPVREIEGSFEQEALKMTGREVEVTGVFKEARNGAATSGVGAVAGYISFWKYTGPPEEIKGDIKAETVSLEALVSNPGRYDGKTIRVYGKFRGKNLYGDLASHSQRDSRDWVMKEDVFAIWVTGRKPKGSGFELDIGMKRDTEKWLQVVGKPETVKGVTYLQAIQVILGKPSGPLVAGNAANPNPTPTPSATPLPVPKPPMVVFALPLDGDGEVPSNGRFQIQFSRDMEEDTFKGRVLIRYKPPLRPGERVFDGARMSYDGGRRALTVDPGDVLRPGREVEILLLPGIVDIDGIELVPRPGRDGGPVGATDLLRFKTETASLVGAR
jgi:hypothetical protein